LVVSWTKVATGKTYQPNIATPLKRSLKENEQDKGRKVNQMSKTMSKTAQVKHELLLLPKLY